MLDLHEEESQTAGDSQLPVEYSGGWQKVPAISTGMWIWALIYAGMSFWLLIPSLMVLFSIVTPLPLLVFAYALFTVGLRLLKEPERFHKQAIKTLWSALILGSLWCFWVWYATTGFAAMVDSFHDPEFRQQWSLYTHILWGWTILTAIFSILSTMYLLRRRMKSKNSSYTSK